MNRKWLTGLALASVAGTGGVAYVALGAPEGGAAAAQAPAVSPDTTTGEPSPSSAVMTTAAVAPARTLVYQVGDAGTVTVDVASATLTGRHLAPAPGWSVLEMSANGAHLELRLTDSHRIVGFVADLVGPEVVVSVTNSVAPGSVDTASNGDPAASGADATVVEQTLPATPASPTAAASAPRTVAVAVARPAPAATTRTSSAGPSSDDHGVERDDHHDDSGRSGGEHDD
jgi:hypothetical protein